MGGVGKHALGPRKARGSEGQKYAWEGGIRQCKQMKMGRVTCDTTPTTSGLSPVCPQVPRCLHSGHFNSI